MRRSKVLRAVARRVSNVPILETGAELERVRRRRSTLIGKLNDLSIAQERAEDQGGDVLDPQLWRMLDSAFDVAQAGFDRGRAEDAIDVVFSAVRELDDAIGREDRSAPRPNQEEDAVTTPAPRQQTRPTVGYRSMEVAWRAAASESGQPTLFGHFAVFDEWTEINSMFEGNFLERIAPGAFAETFVADRDQIRVLFQHGRDAMLGMKPIGTITSLEEQKAGAYYESPLFRGLPELLLDGLANGQYGASFRMEPIAESWVDQPRLSDYNPRGLPERTLTQIRVAEFGPVTFPQYTSATAMLRSRSLTDLFAPAGQARAGSATSGHKGANGNASVDELVARAESEHLVRALELQTQRMKTLR